MQHRATDFWFIIGCLLLLIGSSTVWTEIASSERHEISELHETSTLLVPTVGLSDGTSVDLVDLSSPPPTRFKRGEVDTILQILYTDYYRPHHAWVNPRRWILRHYLNSISDHGWNSTTVYYSCNIVQFASVRFIKDLGDRDLFPRTTLEALNGENFTYGQVLALEMPIYTQYVRDRRHFHIDDILYLPTGVMRVVPADDIYDLHDETAVENMDVFNLASENMLIFQRSSYVRKLMGVPLSSQMDKCDMNSGSSDLELFHSFVPNAEFLEWIPFNNYMNLSLNQLNFYIQKLPHHSAQTMLFMQKLFNCPFKSLRELATPKFLMSLTCEYILKINLMDVRYILEAFDKLPEPYAIDYQIINCLHTLFVNYMNITLAGNRARTEVQLLNLAPDEMLEAAGGLILATMRSEAIGNLTRVRCLRLIHHIGKQPLYRLQMVKPRNSLYAFTEIAMRCANVYPVYIDEEFIQLLGSLTHYLFPRYLEDMKKDTFEYALPHLIGMTHGETAHIVPCQDEPLMTSIQEKLLDVYGMTETWDTGTIKKVSCLLYVLDDSELNGIDSDVLFDSRDILYKCYHAGRRNPEYYRTQVFLDGICYDDIGNSQFYRQSKMDGVQQRFDRAIKDYFLTTRNDTRAKHETFAHPLSCLTFQETGSARFAEIDEIHNYAADDFEECVDWMGAMMIQDEVAEALWDRIKEVYGQPRYIPRNIILQLGSIVRGIPEDDFFGLHLGDLTIAGEFGREGLWSQKDYSTLRAMATVVKRKYKRDIRQYTGWDFLALGQITCGLTDYDIRMISIRSFSDGLAAFAALACPTRVTRMFRNKVVHPNVLGPTRQWGPGTVRAAGSLLAGLWESDLADIRACAFTGVSLSAARNMPPEAFEMFSKNQLKSFTPEVAYNIPATTYLRLNGVTRKLLVDTRRLVRHPALQECIDFRWDLFSGSLTHDDAYDNFRIERNYAHSSYLINAAHAVRCGWLLMLVMCALSLKLTILS